MAHKVKKSLNAHAESFVFFYFVFFGVIKKFYTQILLKLL